MTAVEISTVALFEVPSEPDPYRVGLATHDKLIAVAAEFADLPSALCAAEGIAAELALPITVRLARGALH